VRMGAVLVLLSAVAWSVAGPVPASALQESTQATLPAPVRAASHLHVYLMTIGQGEEIWEKFGHNAIRIRDDSTDYDYAFNYGIFDFDQPGFVARLVHGDMLYAMGVYDATAMADAYARTNRTIVEQELNLTAGQKYELRKFLEWNMRPENKDYLYDYYRDNCSTRVRDALNRVMGGDLRRQLEGIETGTTYRWHTSRLTADEVLAYTGLQLGLGEPVDRPINGWEESFLPVRLMEHVKTVTVPRGDGVTQPLVLSQRTVFDADRPPERITPPRRTPAYVATGVATGFVLLMLGMAGTRRRAARIGFFLLSAGWSLVAGAFGLVILLLWTSTSHVTSYHNENLLQVGPLSLLLFVTLILVMTGRSPVPARVLAGAIAGLAVLGCLLQVLPAFYQVNGPIIGLAMPVHLGLAAGLFALSGRRSAAGGMAGAGSPVRGSPAPRPAST